MNTDLDYPQIVVLLREPTGRIRKAHVYGGAYVEDWHTGARYAYVEAVPTSHGVSVLLADRLYGPERRL